MRVDERVGEPLLEAMLYGCNYSLERKLTAPSLGSASSMVLGSNSLASVFILDVMMAF